MTRTADVVVVGSGIIGASIAYQLARHGAGKVIALDKGAGPGEGSTGASSSICRCRYTYPEVVRLAFHGQESYRSWQAFTGLDNPRSGLQSTGVLWIMGESPEKVAADADKLTGQGVKAEAIGPERLVDLFPSLSTCAVEFDLTGETEHVCVAGEAFLFESEGGFAEPVGANQDLIEAAVEQGAQVEFNSRVTRVLKVDGRVTGVGLADGSEISAGLVINASGPWCNQLNSMAGADLRWTLTPTRIQTVYRSWPSELGDLPVAADASTGIYFRPESRGQQILIGSVLAEDEEEIVPDPDDFKRSPDVGFTEMKLAAFHHRVPALEARGAISGIAGLYTINREDVHPVVGPTGVDGFWVANGFSGHGFKLAPAVGSMIAQAVTGTWMEYDTDVPMSFFSVDREPVDLAVKHVLA
ncbi:MAG TPA: FAD-dependent oxidoreductase [Acidimicrobiia bacterium]